MLLLCHTPDKKTEINIRNTRIKAKTELQTGIVKI